MLCRPPLPPPIRSCERVHLLVFSFGLSFRLTSVRAQLAAAS